MRFLVDAQLPPALARWLTEKGHAAEYVGDVGLQAASDAAIWDHALASSSAIVTKDEDFAQRKALGQAGPAIVLDQASEYPTPRPDRMVRRSLAGRGVGIGTRRDAGRGHITAGLPGHAATRIAATSWALIGNGGAVPAS